MAVNYTTAETVNVEEGVYSADYNKLALAFNDRLKNGVADPTWRLLWYAHSLVRGMRNPNGFNYAPTAIERKMRKPRKMQNPHSSRS